MEYKITLTPNAQRNLDDIAKNIFQKLDAAIWKLRENPRPSGCVKLNGPIYRIRVGRWRIIYSVFEKDRMVIILKLAQRREDTYENIM